MTFKRPYSAGLAALAVGMFAATAAYAEPTISKGDNAWMMTSTVLVLLMTIPGLALFYGGLVRSKNMLSVLMSTPRRKNFDRPPKKALPPVKAIE